MIIVDWTRHMYMGSCRYDRLCQMENVLYGPQLMTACVKWKVCSRTTFPSGVITYDDDHEDETWEWLQPSIYVNLM